MSEQEIVTGQTRALTCWEAALKFAQEQGLDLEEHAGWEFTVEDPDGKVEKFVVDDLGQVVPR